ncbi:MAG: hypothetical protein E6K94_03310 [Thaumarchaeota archaeon]|nr:MAG: hypothetical protein E6K94_03310 [Nitrososphaerota archaeon]
MSAPSPFRDLCFKLISSRYATVGRTVPSFRIAGEMEKRKWKPFRALLDKKDRKIFDEMFSYSRLYNSAGVMACRPVVVHPILKSIIFEHYKQLRKINTSRRYEY